MLSLDLVARNFEGIAIGHKHIGGDNAFHFGIGTGTVAAGVLVERASRAHLDAVLFYYKVSLTIVFVKGAEYESVVTRGFI